MTPSDRRPGVGFLDELAVGALRRWVMAVAAVTAAGYAAGVWVNALVEPWSWSRRSPELLVVLSAVLTAIVARRHPLKAALGLLGVVYVELHVSFFIYGIAGASTVLAPTMAAAAGFLLGGSAAYVAAVLSSLLVLAAGFLDTVVPGFGAVEVERFFYVAVANAAVAVITAKGLEVFEQTARRAETARRATTALIRHAPDGIVTLDAQGRILTANPAAALLLRQTPQTLEGLRLDSLATRLKRADDGGVLQIGDTSEAPVQITATSPDGRVRHMEFTARSFPREDGEVQRLVVLRDVTERVEADAREDRLDAHMHHTQRLAAVAQLAGGLAHDFNNIFTVIRGAAELVQVDAEDDPEGVRESADTILEAQARGADLIRQLLTFARPSEDEPETFAAAVEIRQLTAVLQGLLGERISLKLELHATGGVTMDRQRFRQVVLNLISNARDAMPQGGTLTVALEDPSAGEDSAWVRLSVTDTGTGMEASTVERMFEPFFTTHRSNEHSGLGLATVHGIVERAGGSIRVESAVGEGTTVHVLLPLASSDDAPPPDPTVHDLLDTGDSV